jgi:phosphonoacetaldehyde hydrolase
MKQLPRLRAVLFDWAGTTIDYGSRAPTEAFVEIFRRRGVDITTAEARGPMGMAKRDHLAAISRLPRVATVWRQRYGIPPAEADVNDMYHTFVPLQKEILAREVEVIPGVPEAIAECRRRGLKIGSTTGYSRELMEVVIPSATRGGFAPDVIVCADEVRAGRPAPWLNFRAAEQLDVYPMNTIVVVDDTPVGIEAGLNAGAWTVAVSETGNALGASRAERDAMEPRALQTQLETITRTFLQMGAHFVIPSAGGLPGVLDQIAHQ